MKIIEELWILDKQQIRQSWMQDKHKNYKYQTNSRFDQKKKYGYGMNSRLKCEIMVEGNRRSDFKREQNGYWTNKTFDAKNYEKLSV